MERADLIVEECIMVEIRLALDFFLEETELFGRRTDADSSATLVLLSFFLFGCLGLLICICKKIVRTRFCLQNGL